MFEARAHNQVRRLLKQEQFAWPHHLTLSRLVARSLRRGDQTLIELDSAGYNCWWLGLLIPLCLDRMAGTIVLSGKERNRLLNIEIPRLKAEGLHLPLWQGETPPNGDQLWLLDYAGLLDAYRKGFLSSRQLIVPEVERLATRLREVMAIVIKTEDWEKLRRAFPSADLAIMQLHERISVKLFNQASRLNDQVRIDYDEIVKLKDLLNILNPSLSPWSQFLKTDCKSWASWAELEHKTLKWNWCLKPLDPLKLLTGLLTDQPSLLISESVNNQLLLMSLNSLVKPFDAKVQLVGSGLQEPISLFAPSRQPLPNTEVYASHLLEQSLRLILGRSGLTIILLDDFELRMTLTSQLAAEFGRRVVHETTAPEANGVICCTWSWWIKYHDQLPSPEQLVVALLPFASLESPLVAARVESYKCQGQDWFRDFLLPEALDVLSQAVAPIRNTQTRLAVLDGRLKARSWGLEILKALEPWTSLHRLLPD